MILTNWTRSCFVLSMVNFIFLLLGCGGTSTPTTPQATASFRFVQANPSAGTVDVMIDSALVKSNIAYTTDTGYLTVNAGIHQLLVRPIGGSPRPFVNGMVTFDSDTRNTFILGGWGTISTMSLPLTDDTTPPVSGGIKLRIADVTAEATIIDIFVLQSPNTPSGTPTISPMLIPFASNYLALPAGTYDVFVTSIGTTSILFHTGPMTFSAGQNRTVVLSNDCLPTSCGFNSFKATTLADLN
jgi:hypothetical protein